MARNAAGLITLSIALVACAPQIRTTMIGQPQAPDGAFDEILVFSAKVPDCPFNEVALVSAAKGDMARPGMDMNDLLTALKRRAYQLGGHAIVGLTDRPRTEVDGPSLAATVIRFTSSACRPGKGE